MCALRLEWKQKLGSMKNSFVIYEQIEGRPRIFK